MIVISRGWGSTPHTHSDIHSHSALILILTLITRPDCSGSSLHLRPIFLQVLKGRRGSKPLGNQQNKARKAGTIAKSRKGGKNRGQGLASRVQFSITNDIIRTRTYKYAIFKRYNQSHPEKNYPLDPTLPTEVKRKWVPQTLKSRFRNKNYTLSPKPQTLISRFRKKTIPYPLNPRP